MVSENPNKININYFRNEEADWHHVNSVNYDPQTGYILLSVPEFGEFWVIDRNTTIEEAAGPEGDLLYRWGNPRAYDKGNESDQKLFYQHTVEWITDGPQKGKIIIFNNGSERQPEEYSSVVILDPFNESGEFQKLQLTWQDNLDLDLPQVVISKYTAPTFKKWLTASSS